MDTIGYLYDTSFDPSDPLMNFITEDDDDGDILLQFRIKVYLQSGRTYILVVTTHSEYTAGDFSVSCMGPASINFMFITPTTSRPITISELFKMTFF